MSRGRQIESVTEMCDETEYQSVGKGEEREWVRGIVCNEFLMKDPPRVSWRRVMIEM